MPPRAVQKVMVQPINLIFRFLQNVSRIPSGLPVLFYIHNHHIFLSFFSLFLFFLYILFYIASHSVLICTASRANNSNCMIELVCKCKQSQHKRQLALTTPFFLEYGCYAIARASTSVHLAQLATHSLPRLLLGQCFRPNGSVRILYSPQAAHADWSLITILHVQERKKRREVGGECASLNISRPFDRRVT